MDTIENRPALRKKILKLRLNSAKLPAGGSSRLLVCMFMRGGLLIFYKERHVMRGLQQVKQYQK
jgi:hypothetical protein